MAKILLIDDDPDFRLAVVSMLEENGYQVIEAQSGKEGYEKAVSEKPDLMIIDIMMETYGAGFNLINELKGEGELKDIPRIILTSLGIQQDLDMPYPQDMGTDSILQKPVTAETIIETVRSILKKNQ